jgi:shikimate kinase
MNQHPEARKALADLVARRNPLYAQAALTIDTSGRSIAEAVDSVVAAAGLR